LQDILNGSDIPTTRKRQLGALKKEELLREIIDNVGKRGQGGQDLQNVISVAMLSEGWDAKNVTHIMGLRAFSSQLLCEQVVGRGLRRVSYDTDENGFFLPEYVNVFGVPLSISESGDPGDAPPPPKPTTQIEVLPENAHLEIKWPNILRIEAVSRQDLSVDWSKVAALTLDPASTPISAELAPALGGATDLGKVSSIDLEQLPDGFRLQRLVFQASRKGFVGLSHSFKGAEDLLAAQLVRIVQEFITSPALEVPSLFHNDPLRRRILIALNIDLIVQHLMQGVFEQNRIKLTPVFDEENPIGSTRQMRTWYTTKPNFPSVKSHISHLVGDSSWEGYAANILEQSEDVLSYAKNDHLGFQIQYLWLGSRRRYVPDFLIKYASGKMLVLEIKGTDSPQNKAKRDALAEWVDAINEEGGFGLWSWDVAFAPSEINDIVARHR
jgi:type III restriction enzyme